MKLPKELTTVTTLSKTVALILFTTLPVVAFIFGMQYQAMIADAGGAVPPAVKISPSPEPVGCTAEALMCPDGTAVGRVPPNCEFQKCPTADAGLFCGGIAGKKCPTGYYCKYEGDFPDAGGTCIKEGTQSHFTCPKGGWVNCMPIVGQNENEACTETARAWYEANCPDFKGIAY